MEYVIDKGTKLTILHRRTLGELGDILIDHFEGPVSSIFKNKK